MAAAMALPGRNLSGAATPRALGRSLVASLVLHGVAIGGGLVWLKPWELQASGVRLQAHVTIAEPTETIVRRPVEPERRPIPPEEPAEPEARELPTEPAPPTLEPEQELDPLPDGEWRLASLTKRRANLRIEPPRPDPAPVVAVATPTTPVAPEAVQVAPAASTDAVLLLSPAPRYPRTSVRLGEQGSVLLEIHVARDGQVLAAVVLESSGHERLDKAAKEAVATWRFEPATRAGIAVETVYPHRLTFRLAEAL